MVKEIVVGASEYGIHIQTKSVATKISEGVNKGDVFYEVKGEILSKEQAVEKVRRLVKKYNCPVVRNLSTMPCYYTDIEEIIRAHNGG